MCIIQPLPLLLPLLSNYDPRPSPLPPSTSKFHDQQSFVRPSVSDLVPSNHLYFVSLVQKLALPPIIVQSTAF